ncbi:MAG: hypothetical protein EXQ79_10065 [Acidimicrobiia bacterium]|nr:hypothetical protein [Acidimicrobiia bacterium]
MTGLVGRLVSKPFVHRDLKTAALPWAVARVFVLGALWMSRFLADHLPAGGRTRFPAEGLFSYDGSWYRSIAEHGYLALPKEGLRFFPLYPLLGRGLGVVFADHTGVALVVIANVAALVMGALLHRLVLHETKDPQLALRSAWFVAVFPAALGLVLAYAESLLMLAAVGMFLALRKQRWIAAAAFGVAAGLVRPVGFLLVVPAAIEAARAWGTTTVRERVSRVMAVAAPAVGTGLYLTWVWAKYDDPFLPFSVQNRHGLRGGSVDPFSHVIGAIGDLLDGSRFGAGMHLVWIAVFLVLIAVVARRFPSSYTAYAGVSLLLGLTAANISSFDRYVFSSFPFVLGIAILTVRRTYERLGVALAGAGLVIYAVLAFFHLYVP